MKRLAGLSVLGMLLCLPLPADAHRAWMLPSATVLSGDDPWVTVDAAVSNDLFYFEHFPMRLANIGVDPSETAAVGVKQKGGGRRGGRPGDLVITAPDGSRAEAQNGSIGRYRSTFDVHLTQKGTYKLAVLNDSIFAAYKEGGQTKRWRGNTAEALAKEVPANAPELKITQSQSRMETFVSSGKPTTTALKLAGSGLELVPVTHPNDLVVGQETKFRFVVDGKPASNMKVSIIQGGIRYRDQLNEMTVTSDAEGEITFKLAEPGMYWLNAEMQDLPSDVTNATRRVSYTATLEALPQ
jgi:uncharacterized GH25 family protein